MITVQTLSDHPVGPSVLSNAVELSGREFLPFVLFCYFGVHKRGERCVELLGHCSCLLKVNLQVGVCNKSSTYDLRKKSLLFYGDVV